MIDAQTPRRSRPRLHWAGDSLVLVELEAVIAPAVNRRVIALAQAIGAAGIAGVRDVVPAYASVGVHVDPLAFDHGALEAVIAHAWDQEAPDEDRAQLVQIPVCYGGDFGPDLEEVAAHAGCSTTEVVTRHAAVRYRVYMLGFLPGFAYLGGVDPSIAMPRRGAPRIEVAAGSVGIAGRQTGVYPCVSPGGWRLVGRTPLRMFDAARTPPARLAPGDVVQFVPVSRAEFDALAAEPGA